MTAKVAQASKLARFVRWERLLLWSWFSEATRSAIKTPDPLDREHWSIDMINKAERIAEASRLLGGPTPWGAIGWDCWPYYHLIEGVDLPASAWAWLTEFLARDTQPHPSATWALQYRDRPA